MKPFQVLSILLAFTFVSTIPANADNLYASIHGTVTDPTGAVVSGATLTATNAGTGILYTTTSNSSGAFTFLQLPIGDYTLKAEQTGFKAYHYYRSHSYDHYLLFSVDSVEKPKDPKVPLTETTEKPLGN